MKRHFTEEEMLDVLIAFDQAVNPEKYETSKDMETKDFFDAAYAKASELEIDEKFNNASNKYAKLTEDTIFDYDKKSFFKDI